MTLPSALLPTVVLVLGLGFGFGLETARAAAAGGSSSEWTVEDSHHHVCIRMTGKLSFDLYYLDKQHYLKSASLELPSDATVNSYESSCNTTVYNEDAAIGSQVIQLDFGHDYEGWTLRLAFTQDHRLHGSSEVFVLYQVNLTANYSAQPNLFPGYLESTHTYAQPIALGTLEPSAIADSIYANRQYSYSCAAKQRYAITENHDTIELPAYITLKSVRIQAYAPADAEKFGAVELCPDDQIGDDAVPVVVGAVLAGLVLVTLITYIIYRARQPSSVLYQTNRQSFSTLDTSSPCE